MILLTNQTNARDNGVYHEVMFWSNTRWHRVMNCWLMGKLLGYGSPSIEMFRPGGRPTFKEAWTGKVHIDDCCKSNPYTH